MLAIIKVWEFKKYIIYNELQQSRVYNNSAISITALFGAPLSSIYSHKASDHNKELFG